MQRLWCSWVVKGQIHSFFFGGDTGYNKIAFKQIGEKYGPFSLSALPIGAYEPRLVNSAFSMLLFFCVFFVCSTVLSSYSILYSENILYSITCLFSFTEYNAITHRFACTNYNKVCKVMIESEGLWAYLITCLSVNFWHFVCVFVNHWDSCNHTK